MNIKNSSTIRNNKCYIFKDNKAYLLENRESVARDMYPEKSLETALGNLNSIIHNGTLNNYGWHEVRFGEKRVLYYKKL